MTAGACVLTIGERLDEATVEAMSRGIEAAIVEHARVLVIEGSAEKFCLGMDFASVDETAPPSGGADGRAQVPAVGDRPQHARLAKFAELLRALLAMPCPTLAVVDGPALGGGLGVAAACDYVLASDRARFGLPEALYGLAPAIIRPPLLSRISPQRLRMLVVTAHSRSAHEAAALGLVDEVTTVDGLAAARTHATRQLRRADPQSVIALRLWGSAELATALQAGVDETATALARPSVLAALRAAIAEEDLPWL